MPTHKKRLAIRQKKVHYKFNPFVVLFFVLLLFFGILIKGALTRKYWTGMNKLNVVVNLTSGNVATVIFDPAAGEITTIMIPKDTQVEVARNLGIWKIGSVWNLGKNDGISGKLLTTTISKSLKFPVYIWADGPAYGFISPNPLRILEAAITPYRTNLSFGDKVAIAVFSLKVKNVNRLGIDLDKTTFLKKTKLEDGTEGYIKTDLPSPKLYSNFADDDLGQGTLRVVIKDDTNDQKNAMVVGEIIEIMGGKISAITREQGTDKPCEVRAKNQELSEKVAMIFGCVDITGNSNDNFDLEIRLGKNFNQYF